MVGGEGDDDVLASDLLIDKSEQISQGPITVHADEQLATTDKGVALYRRMLRDAIRALSTGEEPPQLRAGANGQVPTMAGDVIVRVPVANDDDVELQRAVGRAIGGIVHDTLGIDRSARRAEIERRVRARLEEGIRPGSA